MKEGLNKLAGQMSIESADTEYYDDDASDTTTESKYSIAYFSEASYEYLDQLTYQQTGVVLEQVRKYLTDNIKEDIEEMNIDGDTFILNDEQCSFDVNLGNNQVIEVMLNRNEYKVEISSKSH